MNLHTALLATVTVSALLVAACGERADDVSSASTNGSSGSEGSQTASSGSASAGSASAGSGSNGSGTDWFVHTGPVMSSCGSTTTITVRWDWPEWFAYDAPMVFLAQPGPVTATLLATPPHDWSWGHFSTYYKFSQAGGRGDLGITSADSVGTSVTTVSIPGQAPGVPIIFSTYVTSARTAMGALVSTGWVYESGFSCCDGTVRVPAKVSFGANNTAIVSFDSLGGAPPDSWSTTPLRIQLTNVTSVSGCSVQ